MTIWVLIRAAGLGAYVMLFLAVAWGLIATTAIVSKRVSKRSATLFHQFVATAGLALLGVHLGLLLIDSFMPFGIADVLIPLRASYRPISTTLGVIAMYATVAIMVSSWLRKPIGVTWWRRIHLLAIPAFTLALGHGIFSGSDTEQPWVAATYAVTGFVVVFLTIVRALTAGYRPPRATPPTRSTTDTTVAPAIPEAPVGSR